MRIRGLAIPLSESVTSNPVVCKAERIWATLALGAACLRTAHVPVTCGVAIDVPLADPKPPPVTDEVIDTPGAKRDMKEAVFEKDATTSPFVVAPTLIADEIQPGALTAFV